VTGPWTTAQPVGLLGSGWAVPGPAVATDDLIATMERNFGFAQARQARMLARRIGVTHRHIGRDFAARHEAPRPGGSNPELAAAAVSAALADATLHVGDLAYVIAHTATPAQALPANVASVADRLGYAGPYVELRQACTGFGNALMIAGGLIAAGSGPVAIVGSETGSQYFDPAQLDDDPGQIVNMVQMGDAAGAVVLGGPVPGRPAISASWFGGIGLGRPPGISRGAGAGHFDHDFAEIRATGHRLFEAGAVAATALGCAPQRADRIIPHQVGGRIGDLVAGLLGVDAARMVVGADRYGNTGSAAIWLALAQLRDTGLVRGARVLVLGAEASKHFHAGFIYAH